MWGGKKSQGGGYFSAKNCVFVYVDCKDEFMYFLITLFVHAQTPKVPKVLDLIQTVCSPVGTFKNTPLRDKMRAFAFTKAASNPYYEPKGWLTTLHLRMYWVMWTDEGGFHWMGWESGCFPASVMITWTGLWPSEELEKGLRGSHQERAGETLTLLALRKRLARCQRYII